MVSDRRQRGHEMGEQKGALGMMGDFIGDQASDLMDVFGGGSQKDQPKTAWDKFDAKFTKYFDRIQKDRMAGLVKS